MIAANSPRIWKFPLRITDRQTVDMPAGAQVLTAQLQRGVLQMWALCDPAAEKTPRTFSVFGTGNPMPNNPGRYVSTFQLSGGELVFHLFEASLGAGDGAQEC